MNQEEVTEFLSESHIAVMATINRDGTPQLTPNWYHYGGSVLTFVTTKKKGSSISTSAGTTTCQYVFTLLLWPLTTW
jgi:nitroimidazol reductase NimA-like FMN-containing flavoprotein (pyridoxamine 5'-phosphate oxidase superfamily)